jgi:FAD/FMN-containing dehydrogenase
VFTDQLRTILGPGGYLEGDDISARYSADITGYSVGQPALVMRPRTAAEVSQLLKLCHGAGQQVVPQGGMTGLSRGGIPKDGELVLSLERMTDIEEIDTRNGTMTVQAGAILQTVQEHAEDNGFIFPLDLGARGSCTIGGNIATNAGGNRVLRYGMMRELTLGLEVVLADGTVMTGLNRVVKNNAGYDLKHLFIGSEGTLGIVTRAVLKLFPIPKSQCVAFCASDSFDSVIELLHFAKAKLGASLSAFEVMWQSYYDRVQAARPNLKLPLTGDYPYYVLIETSGGDEELDSRLLEGALEIALEDQLVADAVFTKSKAQVDAFWEVRDISMEVAATLQPYHGYDVSIPLSGMQSFVAALEGAVAGDWPDATLVMIGHLGDGNLHLCINLGAPPAQPPSQTIDEVVYTITGRHIGSISAEHGIGLLKRDYLRFSRTEAERSLMGTLKEVMDPQGILNPGRVVRG